MTADQKTLIDALEKHGYDEWFHALLMAAIEETHEDAARAVAIAEEAFRLNPIDPSKPRDDDADALFGAE